ncbi:MAG TPA: hypothetical protein PK685_03760 [archaeon]|jgi:hypothetical protein|nr:hypothetical protein [archaeon]
MNLLTKIIFLILAGIILVLGFVLGTFILTFIFIVLLLMTVLFIIMWLFNNIVTLFKTGTAKLIFKAIFSVLVTYGLITILWIFSSKYFLALEKYTAIITLWVISALIFSLLWYLLHLKKQTKAHTYLWDEYKKNPDALNTWDVLVMLVMPSLIIFIFNAVHLII